MILNRNYYARVSFIRSWWNLRQMKKLMGEKIFKSFKLHKTEWPDKLYFYSPRLKRKPRFTGNTELLASWKDAKICETLCPTHAIKVTAEAIHIDNRGCITCGLCLEVAPPGILEMSNDPLVTHRSSQG